MAVNFRGISSFETLNGGAMRLLGRVNLIDLLVVLLVVLLGAVLYIKLSGSQRIAPQFLTTENAVWVDVELRLPNDRAWLTEHATPGLESLDPRSGKVIAEVRGVGQGIIHLRLLAAKDSQERLVFGRGPLVPGRKLILETEQCIIEGYVMSISESQSGKQ